MINFLTARRAILATSFLVAGSIALPAQANAAGFFEQLFGIAPAPVAPVPSYGYAPAAQGPLPQMDAPRVRRVRRVVDDSKPVLQKTTDLMHDKTLRAGDAVMTKSGIEVYEGWQGARHTRDQFTPLDEADVSKTARKTLVAMDETRRDPLDYVAGAGTIREGRSAATDGAAITAGYKVTDARGRSIRYVGP